MITPAYVLDALQNHRQISGLVMILGSQLDQLSGQGDCDGACAALQAKRDAYAVQSNQVAGWLAILPNDERFIVQAHLIDGLDWGKTIVEYERRWGAENGLAPRSLKRKQAKAIDRIVTCLRQIEEWKMSI